LWRGSLDRVYKVGVEDLVRYLNPSLVDVFK